MAKQSYNGVYESMDFPEYVHREFPKEIAGPLTAEGKPTRVVVESQRHELEVLSDIRDGKTTPVHPAEAVAGELAAQLDAKHVELTEAQAANASMAQRLADLEAKLAAADAPKADPAPAPAAPTPKPLPPLPPKT